MLKMKKKTNKTTQGIKWCERNLVSSPIPYGVCVSERSFRRELKALGHKNPPNWLEAGSEAQVHTFQSSQGHIVVVVTVRPDEDAEKIRETLVHEAVHVWQEIREYIGETEPSKEFEAYSTEAIYANLLKEYKALSSTKKKKKV